MSERRYSDGEGPECPKCNQVFTADEGFMYDESGYELDCDECGITFQVWPHVSYSWTTHLKKP